MAKGWLGVIIGLGILVGLIFGILIGLLLLAPPATPPPPPNTVRLDPPAQDDYIIMVAEAYAAERDLALAQDRLKRLNDPQIAARVERLANTYAPQRDLIAVNLAILAVALGSRNSTLAALSTSPTPSFTPTFTRTKTAPPTPTLRATFTPAFSPTFLPTPTIYYVVITNTPTRTPRITRTPSPTVTDTPKPLPPTIFEPGLDRWWGGIYVQPVDVPSGQGYWHLTKAVYCDAFDNSDPRRHDFGCSEMPGGSQGTSIYIMTGGAPVDVIEPDGRNVGDDPFVVGELKDPNDMCQCTYAFESSNYRISVRNAPSDAIGGFCLCSKNFGWGSRAHVRYFLYFEYVTR